jgi:hypothetical protein
MLEATITIDGKTLTVGQSMAVRVAITSFLMDKDMIKELGPIGPAYERRLTEVLNIIMEEIN